MKHFLALTFLSLLFFLLPTSVSASTINKSLTNQNSLNSGLVGWWTFEGADCGATYCKDKSGGGNTATSTSVAMPAKVVGKIGQAGKFDGSDDYVTMANNNVLDFTTAYTITAWVKPNQLRSYEVLFARGGGDVDDIEMYIQSSTSFVILHNRSNGGTASYVQNWTNPPVGKWTHLVIVYSGGSWKLYHNGVLKNNGCDSGCVDPLDTNKKWMIGSAEAVGVFGSTRNFDGLIDDARFYNRALSFKEITQLYTQGGGKIQKAQTNTVNLNSGLVGWWTFDGGDVNATKVLDKSGLGNHGTRNGTITMGQGKIGQAIKFNAGSDYINVLDNDNLDFGTGPFSAVFWAKFKYKSSGVLMKSASIWGNSPGWGFSYASSPATLYLNVGTSTSHMEYNTGLTTFGWTQLGLMRDSANKIWLIKNGVFYNTGQTFSGDVSNASDLWMGYGYSTSPDGSIDDVRVYNRALSAQEIKQLYQQSVGIKEGVSSASQFKNGLVGWWTFDNSECGATYCKDKSGNGNTGTITGATKTVGRIGQALNFDIANVSVAENASLKPTQITATAWVYPTNLSTDWSTIVMKGSSGAWNDGYGLAHYQGSGNINFFVNAYNGVSSTVASTLSLNKWSFVVGTYDLANIKIYVNGDLKDSKPFWDAINHSTSALLIGQGAGSTAYAWKGKIDDARVYNRALSAQEVKQLYQMGK